jgi:hypothetical protein
MKADIMHLFLNLAFEADKPILRIASKLCELFRSSSLKQSAIAFDFGFNRDKNNNLTTGFH